MPCRDGAYKRRQHVSGRDRPTIRRSPNPSLDVYCIQWARPVSSTYFPASPEYLILLQRSRIANRFDLKHGCRFWLRFCSKLTVLPDLKRLASN